MCVVMRNEAIMTLPVKNKWSVTKSTHPAHFNKESCLSVHDTARSHVCPLKIFLALHIFALTHLLMKHHWGEKRKTKKKCFALTIYPPWDLLRKCWAGCIFRIPQFAHHFHVHQHQPELCGNFNELWSIKCMIIIILVSADNERTWIFKCNRRPIVALRNWLYTTSVNLLIIQREWKEAAAVRTR